MTWLLTGGAGYIGSHVILAFRETGRDVVVLDDLSNGFRQYVPDGVPFVEGSVADPAAVREALAGRGVTGIVHLGGFKYAGVSVQQPLRCYHDNVTGMQVLLEGALEHGVERFVFSGSSSVYGTPSTAMVQEDAPKAPESPYGESKLVGEWLLRDVARAEPRLRHTSLRYFNVVGSGPPHLADHSPHNLFPRVLKALTTGEVPKIWGDDYPTPDGTPVRDYIHVVDLADAHVTAAARLEEGAELADAYNVGRGEGTSVRQIMDAMRRATGIDFEPEVGPRRPGDPAFVVGSTERIARDLDWHAHLGVDEMVASAWAAWRHHVDVYGGAPA